jgi:hypothetical protein
MHEIMLTRGDVRGLEEIQLMVHDPRNCGWVHSECHPMAESKEGLIRGVKYLIKYEGKDRILAFLNEMADVMIGNKGPMILAIIEEIENESNPKT